MERKPIKFELKKISFPKSFQIMFNECLALCAHFTSKRLLEMYKCTFGVKKKKLISFYDFNYGIAFVDSLSAFRAVPLKQGKKMLFNHNLIFLLLRFI